MKIEYDLSTLKRTEHPLRKKVLQGKLKLINPLDIPDRETKLAALASEEREFVIELLSKYASERG